MSASIPDGAPHKRPKTTISPTLEPPEVAIDDPGAHELESSSDDDEHFSDATEGQGHTSRGNTSPIPITHIEKVDSTPSQGEVPGTEAYKIRSQDAMPDEIEFTSRGRTECSVRLSDATPGGAPIPTTVLEKVGPSQGDHDHVPGVATLERTKVDARPDRVTEVPDAIEPEIEADETDLALSSGPKGSRSLQSNRSSSLTPTLRGSSFSNTREDEKSQVLLEPPVILDEYDEAQDGVQDGIRDNESLNNEGFGGDDFDDFEEGDVDEFGEFGEIDARGGPELPTNILIQSIPVLSLPVLDFSTLPSSDILSVTQPYMDLLFNKNRPVTTSLPSETDHDSLFLTERSSSLYAQLLTPPPLSPPNWLRSRIRRLFLVSLGVPVDLDEILPASKQKKLVLPSTSLGSRSRSPSPSSRPRGASQRSGSTKPTDVGSTQSSRRKGPPPAPKLDLVHLRSLAEQSQHGLGAEELKGVARVLDVMIKQAGEVLEYWEGRRESGLKEKEAFEGVIENLVAHARKVRK